MANFVAEFEKEFADHNYTLHLPITEEEWNLLYHDQYQSKKMTNEQIWSEIETYFIGQIISRCKDLNYPSVCLFLDQLSEFVNRSINFPDPLFTEPLFKEPYFPSYPLCQGLCCDFELIFHSLETLLNDSSFPNFTREQLHIPEIVQKLDKILVDSGKFPDYSLYEIYNDSYLSENDSSCDRLVAQLLQMMENDQES